MRTVPGGDSARRWGAWALLGVSLLLLASVPWSLSGGVVSRPGLLNPPSGAEPLDVVLVAAFAVAGAGLVHARPRNPIGWLLVACGVLHALAMSSEAYGTRALTEPGGALPLGLAAMWVASWTWMPAVLLPIAVLPPLYPTGRAPSPYWVWHLRVAVVGIAVLVVVAATVSGGVDDVVPGTTLPWTAPAWWEMAGPVLAAVLLLPVLASSLVGTLVRTARATFPERQQLLWLLLVVAAMLITVLLPFRAPFLLAYAAVPVAVAVGVLRYRLLGIEVAVRRTLLYLPLTALVALTIGVLTTTVARLVPDGPVPLVVASAVVAVLVVPLAARLRAVVDRFVLGERADPLAVLDRAGSGLTVASDDPVASTLQVIAGSVGAAAATVHDDHGRLVAAVGDTSATTASVDLRHGGELLGRLGIAPRRGARLVTEGDARLVAALAPHLAVVVRSRQLTESLARERERVVGATLAERARLRQDLHDGLGPALSGISLGLEAAAAALPADLDVARDLLARTREAADDAVREIRRVLDGLRPAALDRLGLVDALRETAGGLGFGRPGRPHLAVEAAELPPLPAAVEEAAYRIATESLTNVARHAGARQCRLSLEPVDGLLRLQVHDDGAGGCAPRPGGVGLDSMRRRATALGGRLHVEPAVPTGTSVTALLPLVAR